MVKKVREYKSGDFIFAKVKGYPAWPARVQRMNGKKYFVYFYGTGETANLPPNMIFDYAENKDKFLTKTVKRRDFNDGVKQIEHDFANNVPLEQVIGINPEVAVEPANETANDSAISETLDETAVDTTAADDTAIDESVANTTQNETAVDDSDDTGALVIDEGKPKGRKSKAEVKVPAKETPAKPVKEPKTPRGKAKKEEPKKEDDEEEKKEDEIVSRSGRKIRPKRYIDEQTEENATLPSPAPKKRRGASPATDKDKEVQKEKEKPETDEKDKNIKHFTAVTQSELEDLKEPFKSDDPEKDNILIAYLPTGQYVGIKLFQSRPTSFKNDTSRLQWDKQAAANAITLKLQLEEGQITTQSVITQLVMDLNLTDEEKATLDKEREMEEKKSRLQFLKTEMKLIELDAKIKTCLSLEKADTDLCLKLLDEMTELEVKPLMLLKHPTCLETIKRMRAYVGNTPSWDLSESAALVFSMQAHRIRKQADTIYKNTKELFTTPEGLSFWEFFSERVLQFKKVTSKLTADELLELVHEPLEMSVPTSHTMKAAVEAANEESNLENETPEEVEQTQKKKNSPNAKAKKPANNNTKTPIKRQSSRKLQQEEKAKSNNETDAANNENEAVNNEKANDKITEKKKMESELDKELGAAAEKMDIDEPTEERENDRESDSISKETEKASVDNEKSVKENDKSPKQNEKSSKDNEKIPKDNGKSSKDNDKSVKDSEEGKSEEKVEEKEKEMGEPRAKRTRESKKTEPPPPRSPAKRKAKC